MGESQVSVVLQDMPTVNWDPQKYVALASILLTIPVVSHAIAPFTELDVLSWKIFESVG